MLGRHSIRAAAQNDLYAAVQVKTGCIAIKLPQISYMSWADSTAIRPVPVEVPRYFADFIGMPVSDPLLREAAMRGQPFANGLLSFWSIVMLNRELAGLALWLNQIDHS